MKTKLILIISTFLAATPALAITSVEALQSPVFPAPRETRSVSSFRSSITDAEKVCPELNCPDSGLNLRVMSRREIQTLSPQVMSKLVFYANHIANSEWPDTILEGPFLASFQIGMREIALIYKNGAFLGYRMVFEDQGWEVDSCKYDPREPSTLATCLPGTFVESAFVSANLSEFFRDPNGFVEFHPGGDESKVASPRL